MKVKVVAESDIGSFIGQREDGDYEVFTLDDVKEIELGDVLVGPFEGGWGDFFTVQNSTRKESVQICADLSECSLGDAIGFLLDLMHGKPGTIFAGGVSFVSNSNDVARQLMEEILGR